MGKPIKSPRAQATAGAAKSAVTQIRSADAPRRGRGRPKLDEDVVVTTVRLPRELSDFAQAYGGDKLAEGIRRALQRAKLEDPASPHRLPLPAGNESLVAVDKELIARLSVLGSGSPTRGIQVLLRAAEVLGEDVLNRLVKEPRRGS